MASSYKSIAPKDSEGNRRLLSKYGGGSKGPRQPYATGGAVKRAAGGMVNMDDEEDMPDDSGSGMPDMSAEGDSAPPRLDRPGRKMHGKDKGKDAKDKKGGTNVNVIIMPPGGAPGGAPPPGGPMPPMMAGPPPGPPPGPPMPPPGAGPGGPPMGMHAKGGRVGYKTGGKVMGKKRADGGMAGTQSGEAAESGRYKAMEDNSKSYSPSSRSVMENAHDIADPIRRAMQGKEWRNQAQNSSRSNESDTSRPDSLLNGPGFTKGGKVGRAMGGKAPVKMTDGAGGGLGRLEKIKRYGK